MKIKEWQPTEEFLHFLSAFTPDTTLEELVMLVEKATLKILEHQSPQDIMRRNVQTLVEAVAYIVKLEEFLLLKHNPFQAYTTFGNN